MLLCRVTIRTVFPTARTACSLQQFLPVAECLVDHLASSLTTNQDCSLLERSGLPTSNLIPVAHGWKQLTPPPARITGCQATPCHFILATGHCTPGLYICVCARMCVHTLSYSQHHLLHPKDGGSRVLRNIGILPQHLHDHHNTEGFNLNKHAVIHGN